MLTKTDKEWIVNNFVTKPELKEEIGSLEQRLDEKAQKRHSELLDLFDGLAKEVKDNDEFRLVTNHRLDRLEGIVGVTD